MNDTAEPDFDLFLSHASEDKPAVRQFAGHLRDAGLRVWLDEERMPPGFDARKAIPRGIDESRHVVVWVTQHWQKPWTDWEIQLFDEARARGCRIIVVLHVEPDSRSLGPYLASYVKVEPNVTAAERLWLVHCGVYEQAPGERALWSEHGAGLVPSLRVDADRTRQIGLLRERTCVDPDDAALNAELASLEGEATATAEFFAGRGPRPPGYRVSLDRTIDAGAADGRFRDAVKAVLQLLDYRVVDLELRQLPPGALLALHATKEGDFETEVLVFHAVRGLVMEDHLTALVAATPAVPSLRAHHVVTNSFVAPGAREMARMRGVHLHTYEQLLDHVLRLGPYLRTWVRDYHADDPVYKTYIGVKYLRRGEGTFAAGRVTKSEFLIAESSDGAGFQVKGELDEFVDVWSSTDGGGQVCLLGDYGAGKTSFMRHYFDRAAQAYLAEPSKRRIPLLVNLSRYSKSASIEQLMTDYLVNECHFRGDFRTFLKLAEMGKLLVLLDGFDEMARQVDVPVRRHNFREIARLLVGDSKVVLSGRSNYFLTHEEVVEILGQAPPVGDPYKSACNALQRWPKYQVIEAALFDPWQIKDYFKKQSEWLASVGVADWRDLERTIRQTYNLDELARTPVLLEIMTKTLPHVRGQVAHLNAARLYDMYTEQWLNREYDKGEYRHLVNRGDKELFVLDLAWHMLGCDAISYEVHFSEISERVRRHFKLDRATEIEHFASDIRFCSFLVHAEHTGTYKFIHKSFMEYFVALRIKRALFDEKDPTGITGVQKLPNEVFFFLCQMVDVKEAAGLQALTRRTASAEARNAVMLVATELLVRASEMELSMNRLEAAALWVALAAQYAEEFQILVLAYHVQHLSGEQHWRARRPDEAASCFEAAQALAQADGDDRRVAQSLLRVGEMRLAAGTIDDSERVLRRARELFERIGDGAGAARTALQMGHVATTALQFQAAIGYYDIAYQQYSALLDRCGQVQALRAMSADLSTTGRLREALEKLEQAMALNAEIGDDEDWTVCLQHGDLLLRVGQVTRSTEAYTRALSLTELRGDRKGKMHALHALGTATLEGRHFEAARHYLFLGLQEARHVGDLHAEAGIATTIANLEGVMGNLPRAVELAGAAVSICEALANKVGIARNYRQIGQWMATNDTFGKAQEAYEKALQLFTELNHPIGVAEMQLAIGKVFNEQKDLNAAESALGRALEIYRKLDMGLESLAAFHELALVQEGRGDLIVAETGHINVLKLAEANGALNVVVDSLAALGRVRARLGDAASAVDYFERSKEWSVRLGRPTRQDVDDSLVRMRIRSRNQFQVSYPERSLFGRRRELAKLESAVTNGQGVLVLGERRAGKTSLLWALANKLQGPTVPVMINLAAEAGGGDVGLVNRVIHIIVEKINSALNEAISKVDLVSFGDFPSALSAVVEQARTHNPELRLVLILDEIDQVLVQSLGVEQALRAAVASLPNRLVVIAAATYFALKPSRRPVASPLVNLLVPVALGPWEPYEAAQFITETFAGSGVTISESAIEHLVQVSGGFPYYVQLIGYYLLDQARAHGSMAVGVQDVERVSVSPEMQIPLESTLGSLDERETHALVDIVSGRRPDQSLRSATKELLRRRLVLEDDGRLRPALGLLKHWAPRLHSR